MNVLQIAYQKTTVVRFPGKLLCRQRKLVLIYDIGHKERTRAFGEIKSCKMGK